MSRTVHQDLLEPMQTGAGRWTVRLAMATVVAATMTCASLLAADDQTTKRLNDAAIVFAEVMDAADMGIPQELLEKAHCIVIVPDLKTAAFLVGAKYGKGFILCRNKSGAGWSA